MKTQHIGVGLTIINLVIMTFLLAQLHPTKAQQQVQNVTPVLRAHALEIVDSLGKVRASITIQPPVVMGGKEYPQTVLLRLIDNRGKPLVKLGAASNGSGLNLSDSSDEGVLILARDTSNFIKLTYNGKERIIQP